MQFRNSLFTLFVSALLITAIGCSKDDSDPCDDVMCLNGGECVNGECDCPEMYTGPDCSDQVTPTQIRITRIDVHDFPPLKDNGDDWDAGLCGGGNPDIFIEIDDGNGVIYSSDEIDNCIPGESYTYTSGLPVSTDEPNNLHSVTLIDMDTGLCAPSDILGTVQNEIYNSTNAFPETITFSSLIEEIEVVLHVEYVF